MRPRHRTRQNPAGFDESSNASLRLRTTTSPNCEAVARRVRIQGSQTFVSLNARLECNKEEISPSAPHRGQDIKQGGAGLSLVWPTLDEGAPTPWFRDHTSVLAISVTRVQASFWLCWNCSVKVCETLFELPSLLPAPLFLEPHNLCVVAPLSCAKARWVVHDVYVSCTPIAFDIVGRLRWQAAALGAL